METSPGVLSSRRDDVPGSNNEKEEKNAFGKTEPTKFKKAPDAPKRFRSAFIIFSAEKHREIKQKLEEKGTGEKTTGIAKLVSEAWKNLSADEREIWEDKAERDKVRYTAEKAMYRGPWKVPAKTKTVKDPDAPKRPMSAFLAFSNTRRAALKREHRDATNADLSKMLSKAWKELDQDVKGDYIEEEKARRDEYKAQIKEWRKNAQSVKKARREEREAFALRTAEVQHQMRIDRQKAIQSQSAARANQLIGEEAKAKLAMFNQIHSRTAGRSLSNGLAGLSTFESRNAVAVAAAAAAAGLGPSNSYMANPLMRQALLQSRSGSSSSDQAAAMAAAAAAAAAVSPSMDQQYFQNLVPHRSTGFFGSAMSGFPTNAGNSVIFDRNQTRNLLFANALRCANLSNNVGDQQSSVAQRLQQQQKQQQQQLQQQQQILQRQLDRR